MNRLFFLTIVVLLAGCAYQPIPQAYDPPGFFSGLIHGWTSPIALFIGLFSEVRVYSFPNSGWFYDLGFMLGISSWGGVAATK